MGKKLFICHTFRSDNDTQYAVLADNSEEAKKIVVNFVNKHYEPFTPPYTVPYSSDDIGIMDVESVKQSMIAENSSLEVL